MGQKDIGILQDWFTHHLFVPLKGTAFWAAIVGSVVGFVLLMAILQQLSSHARKRLTVVCAFLAGLFYSVEFFWPPKANPLSGYDQPLGNFMMAIGSFAVGLGLISLCHLHGRKLARFSQGWENSAAFFVALIAMLVFSFWQMYAPSKPGTENFPAAVYRVLFDGFLNALGSTTFSLLAFFIVSAAYRAFRVNTLEATLMMITAFLVMLGQVPIGMALTSWLPDHGVLASLRLERINNWILTGINSAAFRGILFGAAVGSLAMALRVWLSLEKGAYFEQQL